MSVRPPQSAGLKIFAHVMLWPAVAAGIIFGSAKLAEVLQPPTPPPVPTWADAIFCPEQPQPLRERLHQVEQLLQQGHSPHENLSLFCQRLADSARHMPEDATTDMADYFLRHNYIPKDSYIHMQITQRLLEAAPLTALKAWHQEGLIDITKPATSFSSCPPVCTSPLEFLCESASARNAAAKAAWLIQLGANVNEARYISRGGRYHAHPHADDCAPSILHICLEQPNIDTELLLVLLQNGAKLLDGEEIILPAKETKAAALLSAYHIPYRTTP